MQYGDGTLLWAIKMIGVFGPIYLGIGAFLWWGIRVERRANAKERDAALTLSKHERERRAWVALHERQKKRGILLGVTVMGAGMIGIWFFSQWLASLPLQTALLVLILMNVSCLAWRR